MADSKLTALTEISVPAMEDLLYTVDDPSGTPVSNKVTVERLFGFLQRHISNGRLTTESGVPLSTSDRTAQSTLYFTPYLGEQIALYDGTRWKLYKFTERSLALSGLTSDKNYDVFLYDNSGTLTLELSAAWTSDTTRADALTAQDGIWVKSGAMTRRYLGTIRATAATTTEDSLAKRFVWNHYNRLPRPMGVFEATNSWTYTTDAWRQANASAANQLDYVAGLADVAVEAAVQAMAENSSASRFFAVGIGVDSDTTVHANSLHGAFSLTAANAIGLQASYRGLPGLGRHRLVWLERGDGSGTVTWYGDLNDATKWQFGITGWVMG